MHPCVYRGVLCEVRGVKKERGRDRRVQCLGVVVEVVRVLFKEGGPRIRGCSQLCKGGAPECSMGMLFICSGASTEPYPPRGIMSRWCP